MKLLDFAEEAEDDVHMVVQHEGSKDWSLCQDIQVTQSKNRDSILWDTKDPPHR